MRRKKQDAQKAIAKERIETLFAQAEEMFAQHPDLSKRYVVLARKIAEKYRIHFTKEQKQHFCKQCNAYLRQGANARVRLQHGTRVIRCLECNHLKRMNYR